MAAHESLAGIALVDYKTYEVTSVVDIGAGIDDVSYCTFIMKSGGLLRWTTGCSTKYTLCHFIETDSAYSLGSDNKNNASGALKAPRWNGNITCAPEYYGCVFTMSAAIARSDWDIGSSDFTGASACSPKFLKSADGAKCYIKGDRGSFFSHVVSLNAVSDGIVLNMASSTCIEFNPVPANFNNFTAIDNHPGNTTRHVVYWNPNSTVDKLSARNVTIVGSGTLNLKDPVGEVIKTDPIYPVGNINGIRSYNVSCINSATKASINPQVTITSELDDAIRYDQYMSGGAFTGTLLDYKQVAGSFTVTYDNSYRRAISLYGYKPLVASLSVAGAAIEEGLLYVDPDAGITSSTQAAVLGFTYIDSAERLYDAVHVYQITRTDRHNVGEVLAAAAGTQIDFGSANVTVSAAAPVAYPLVVSGGDITAYTDARAFAVSGKFNKLIADTFIFNSALVVPTNCNLTGDVVLGAVSDLTNLTVVGSITFTVAGTYIFSGVVVLTLINTSGGEVIIQADPTTTIGTLPDPSDNITIESAPVTITVTIIDDSTELAVTDAKMYMAALAGGGLTAGDVILGPEVAGVDGIVSGALSITSPQPFEAMIVESVAPNLYYPKRFIGTISNVSGYTTTIGLTRDDN